MSNTNLKKFVHHDSSNLELNYGAHQNHMNMSPQASLGLYSEEDANLAYKMQKQEVKKAKKEGLDHLYKQDYQPAKFAKAKEFRNSHAYMKKLPSGHYVHLKLFRNNWTPLRTQTS